MLILRNPRITMPCVLVLGMFDGVHCGHQELLRRGRQLADEHQLLLQVCTFEPHPVAVLFPDKTPPRLTTQTQRAALMQRYGVDALCVTTFTKAFAAMSPEQFVAKMAEVYHPKVVVTGFNFTFGDRGRGNAALLQAMEEQYGYETVVVPAVLMDGEPVSSTRIRKLLSAGRLDDARRLLGHDYSVCGRVVHGPLTGRSLGFPTANIAVKASQAMPAHGVYACRMTLRGSKQPHRALVHVGSSLMQQDGPVTVEAHVLNEALSLYGAQVRLDFLSFRREERTFDCADDLREQLALDVEDARRYFAEIEL